MVTKRTAQRLAQQRGGYVYTERTFGNYSVCGSLDQFAAKIQALGRKGAEPEMYCEFVSRLLPVTPFFDIDCKEPDKIEAHTKAVLTRIEKCFSAKNINAECTVFDASSATFGSRHIVVRLRDNVTQKPVLFKNVKVLKDFIQLNGFDLPGVDQAVYREGLFRTVYSDKNGSNIVGGNPQWASRPFLPLGKRFPHQIMELDEIKLSLISYVPEPYIIYEEASAIRTKRPVPSTPIRIFTQADAEAAPIQTPRKAARITTCDVDLAQYVIPGNSRKSVQNIITQLYQGKNIKHEEGKYVSYKGFCPIAQKHHKSNRQYLVVKPRCISVRCQDESCKDKDIVFTLEQYPCLEYVLPDALATPIHPCFSALVEDEARALQKLIDTYDPRIAIQLLHYDENVVFDEDFYIYENGFWSLVPDRVFLGKISDDFQAYILSREYLIKKEKAKRGEDAHADELVPLIRKNSDYSFPKSIRNAIASNRYVRNFRERLNSNRELLPFQNGVYDLRNDVFRPAEREDYLCDRLNFDYDKTVYDKEALAFLHEILPNEERRNYVLHMISMALRSTLRDEVILFFLGCGANGKSTFINFLMSTFPKIATVANSSVLASRAASNSANASPDLAAISKHKIVFLPETTIRNRISADKLKLLTGHDHVAFRRLYQNEEVEKFQQLYCVAMNHCPEIVGADRAVWRRIRIIDFDAKFVPHPTNQGELIHRPEVQEHIESNIRWFQTLVNVLLDFKRDSKPVVPKCIQDRIHLYMQASLDFEEFLDAVIRPCEKAVLSPIDMAEAFMEFKGETTTQSQYNKLKQRAKDYIMMKKFPDVSYGIFHCPEQNKSRRGFRGLKLFSFPEVETSEDKKKLILH